MSYSKKLKILSLIGATFSLCLLVPDLLWAGEYLNSAHGSSAGVDRLTGYATGNCAHCHEMHASIAGTEPDPLPSGVASPYTLFATNFSSSALPGNYAIADNFCFYCHSRSGVGLVQVVPNKDYSETFGGATVLGVEGVREAFNQTSYHNLADIHDFVDGKDGNFPWYTAFSNPCNACHNPHLAKKNFGSSSVFITPLASAISKPSAHLRLWGETETMASYSYEPPYSTYGGNREPDGTSTTAASSKTPDYIGFCTDCHDSTTTILSTTIRAMLGRDMLTIDWLGPTPDKHGGLARDGGLDAREPYATAIANGNFVLSCLDCHEPHGSPNIMLIRRWVNGGSVDVSSLGSMKNLCARCHSSNWEYIHHFSADHPYVKQPGQCNDCHAGDGGFSIPCVNCHFHGSDDSWVPVQQANPARKTF